MRRNKEQMSANAPITTLLLSALGLFGLLSGCTPRQDVVYDTSRTNPDIIDSIVLKPSNDYLIASPDNEVDLTPVCYYTRLGKKYIIPLDNISDEDFVWRDEAGNTVSRHYIAKDPALAGQDRTFTVTMKGGKKLQSAPATIHIVAPTKSPERVVIPIVFHLIQTYKEVTESGIHYEYGVFTKQLDKLNRVFANTVVKTATGVDARIQFVPAVYDPNGEKMVEPGLNRVLSQYHIATDQIRDKDLPGIFEKIIADAPNVDWPSEDYLNVWLVSEASDNIKAFGKAVLEKRIAPKYLIQGATTDGMPGGIEAAPLAEGQSPELYQKGIPFLAQDILPSYKKGESSTNEFIYYIGRYLGLKPTPDDDLKLTVSYSPGDNSFYLSNNTDVKETETNFFRSTNIMDDRHGLHVSISQDQVPIMHWTLQNVVGRQAWRSTKALTGH